MGMEVIFAVIFWTTVVYWVGQNVVIDGMYAARGQVSPRRQERLARVARGEAPERYGFGGWFTDLTEDALRANTAKRRRTARQKAREKAEQEADARRQAEESEETPEQQPVDDMVDVVGVRGGTRPPGSRPSPRPRPNAPIPDAPTLRTVPVEERPPHTHNGSNGHRVVEPEWLTPDPDEHLIVPHPVCGRCGKGRIISVRADGDEQCNACGWKNPNLACSYCEDGRVYPTASGDGRCGSCGRTYPTVRLAAPANGPTPASRESGNQSTRYATCGCGVRLPMVAMSRINGVLACPDCEATSARAFDDRIVAREANRTLADEVTKKVGATHRCTRCQDAPSQGGDRPLCAGCQLELDALHAAATRAVAEFDPDGGLNPDATARVVEAVKANDRYGWLPDDVSAFVHYAQLQAAERKADTPNEASPNGTPALHLVPPLNDQPNNTDGISPSPTEGTDMFNASGETTRVDATRNFLTELENHINNSVLPAIEKCAASAGAENVDPEVVATIAGLRDRFSSAAAGAGDARVKHDDWARLMEEAVNNTANPAKTDYYRHQ